MKKQLSFVEQHAPKHQGLEEWNELMKPVQHRIFAGTAPPPPRPQTLLEFYLGNDLRQLVDDMHARPEHYTDRQREILHHLVHGTQVSSPVDMHEKDELFLQWQRQSDLSAKSKDLVKKITDARHEAEKAEDEETIMPDGRSLAEHRQQQENALPSFEAQNFGDKIII